MKVSYHQLMVQEQKSKEQLSILNLRSISLSVNRWPYYPQYNLFVNLNFFRLEVYFINGNKVEYDKVSTEQISHLLSGPRKILCLDDYIVIYKCNHFIKINFENFQNHSIFKGSIFEGDIFSQINGKFFISMKEVGKKNKIYQLRNFKISHTQLNKFKIFSTKYFKPIVQAFSDEHLFYYNSRMTKQIRKFYIYNQNQPILNSIYLLVPLIYYKNNKFMFITLYDIQSLKIKGSVIVTDRNELKYDSCIFISDYNVVGVLQRTRLDLYNFTTLKYIRSQKIDNLHDRELNMRYDVVNGLTIFK